MSLTPYDFNSEPRKVIHLMGMTLEAVQRDLRWGYPSASKQVQVMLSLALHEYQHFCYGKGDFGSDVMKDLYACLDGGKEAPREEAN